MSLTKGFVYLIYDYYNLFYKIGVTKGTMEKRLEKLLTGNPSELKVVAVYLTKHPYRMETILHNRYAHYKVLNEWYNLDKEVVDNFINICTEIDKLIIAMNDNPFFNKDGVIK